MKYTGIAPAKINLALDVLRKRPDGYHEISTIMQSIPLYDIITIRLLDNDEIIVSTDSQLVPSGNSNIVYKAAKLIKDTYDIEDGVEIQIEKNIPVAAGLAGGSTDAAAAIRLLDKAFNLRLSREEMHDAARRIGADVSFCIDGGTALAQGVGEVLTPIPQLPHCYILVVKPDISVSTKEIYEELNMDEIVERPDISGIIKAIENNDLKVVSEKLCNVMESVTIKKHPLIGDLKKKLMEFGALGSLMSGSGPSVFGIFDHWDKAHNAYNNMEDCPGETFLLKTIDLVTDNK